MKKNLLFILLAFGLSASLLLSGCDLISPTAEPTPLPPVTSNGTILAEGRVVPAQSARLVFPLAGQVESISVSNGAEVKAGDVLVQLGQRTQAQATFAAARLEQEAAQQALDQVNRLADLARSQAQQQVAVAQKTLTEAQKAFDDLDRRDFREELDDRQIDVQAAQDDLEVTQQEFDKYKDLDPNNATRKTAETNLENARIDYQQAVYERDLLQNQLDQVTAALELAKAGLAEAQRAYQARLEGPDPEEYQLAQARLENANAQVAAAEEALANYDLLAPFDGQVLDDTDLFVGQWVSPFQPIVILADASTWYVETKDLNELDVVDIKLGQSVEISPDAIDGLIVSGSVEQIAETYTEKSGDVVYLVRIRLDERDDRLRWGMTVEITFLKD